MTTTPGSSSERTISLQRVISLFVAEIKLNLLALSLIIIGMELFLFTKGGDALFNRDIFVLLVAGFLLFFCCVEHLFGIFIKGWISSIFSILPAILLVFLLRDVDSLPGLEISIVLAVVARILLAIIMALFGDMASGKFRFPEVWLYLALDAGSLAMYFFLDIFAENLLSDKLLFVSLVILTFSGLQAFFYEQKKNSFPFHYFVILGLLTALLPMKTEPIDWTPFLNAGYNIVSGIMNTIDEMNYNFSVSFGNGAYTAGYNSFEVAGDGIVREDKTQIILKTEDKPYLVFTEEESGKRLKVRRTAYLVGGRGADYVNLVSFLSLLHAHNADSEYAALFSRLSKVQLEYAYLNTRDEIAPINSVFLTAAGSGKNAGKEIMGGVSDKKHRKGYKLSARYLEIDYGSPYLMELINGAGNIHKDEAAEENMLSYDDACKYFKELYNARLEEYMTQESYEETVLSIKELNVNSQIESEVEKSGNPESLDFLDTSGATEKMTELAAEISGDDNYTDFEKCKAIEKYLRQYPYNTNAQGGYDPESDLSSAMGMSDIADRFLFDTQKGYCVHFTSAMVMLLRLNGIPARVSVGYRYVYPFEAQDSYEVSSSLAHAWPEAYIEGAGWIPFEPTSGYLPAEDYTWHKKIEMEEKSGKDYENLQIPKLEVQSDDEPTEEAENATQREITPALIRIAVIVGLSIAFIIILLILGTLLFSKLRYKLGTSEKKFEIDVEQIKKVIRHNYEKSTGNAFVERGLLSDYINIAPDSLKDDTKKVFSIYYRLLYGECGGSAISAEESALARGLRMKYK